MKQFWTFLLMVLTTTILHIGYAQNLEFDNPIAEQRADPWVHKTDNGQYYLIATVPEYDRIVIRKSNTINGLKQAAEQVVWHKHDRGPMSHHIWAPELHRIDGKWYIYFAAGEADDIWNIRMWVLSNPSDDPMEGDWTEEGRINTQMDSFSLDATTFEHRGKRYLIWAQNVSEGGHATALILSEMKNPTTLIGPEVAISKPEFSWEKRKYLVNEGAALIKRDGRIFVTYSASATNHYYCLGLLWIDEDADLLDASNWSKSPGPVFYTNEELNRFGPGHNSFTMAEDGETVVMIYHARDYKEIDGPELSDPNRATRARVVRWTEDGFPDFRQYEKSNANPDNASPSDDKIGEKELYIPSGIRFVPDDNDFHDKESEFSFHRMVESDNVAIFWHREYGDDPMANPDESRRFDVHYALEACERYYKYYVNELKLVEKGNSISDKYKLLLIVFGGDVATAFGGGAEDKVGIMWTNSTRINQPPYGVLAHEMAHSFQFLARVDNGGGPRGPLMEASAQYLLWQVLPEWMTFENYHLVDYMTATHYAFLHPRNMYNSPYFLEYWSQKHGKTLFGRILRETQEGEDPVMTYQRITSIGQESFNDEMFDAARRFITWDLERVAVVANQYANQHLTILNEAGDDWFRIDPSKCPQNYGYNGIRLNTPPAGTLVQLEFRGLAGADGFNAVNVDKAGWRYGFLASLEGGRRVYSDIFSNAEGSATFAVPENTEYLWLVVSGAPKEHWPVVMRRNTESDEKPEEHWPYQIRLRGTSPHELVIQ